MPHTRRTPIKTRPKRIGKLRARGGGSTGRARRPVIRRTAKRRPVLRDTRFRAPLPGTPEFNKDRAKRRAIRGTRRIKLQKR